MPCTDVAVRRDPLDEHPNATIIRCMADSDDLGPLDFVTDDVVWHVLGRDESYRGKAEMQRGSGAADYEWVGEKTHDRITNDDQALSMLEATTRPAGKTISFRTVEIYYVRDGKISERWVFSTTLRRSSASSLSGPSVWCRAAHARMRSTHG
jgi:ketosteroid isomerase-like protein